MWGTEHYAWRPFLWGALLLLPISTSAQQDSGGLSVTLDYGEQITFDSTSDNDEALVSTLGLSLSSETRTQTFALNVNGALEKTLSDLTIADPQAGFTYALQGANTAISLSGLYRENAISQLVASDTLGESDLVLADGDRRDTNLSARLDFGLKAPFGGQFSLSQSSTDYSGAGTAGLLDTQTTSANLNLTFRIDPRLTARITTSVSDTDRDGGLDVRNTQFGIGANLGITQTLSGNVELGVTRVDQSGSVPNSTTEGEFYALGLSQTLENGALSGTLNSDVSENGRRTSLRVNRQLEQKRYQLQFGAGLSRNEDTSTTSPLYSLGYSRPLQNGSFSTSFEQVFSTNNAGEERQDSRLRLSLNKDLSKLSRLSAVADMRDTQAPGSSASSEQQITLGFDYSRTLSDKLSMVAGYTHTRRDLSTGTQNDDRIYFGVRLRQAWRP